MKGEGGRSGRGRGGFEELASHSEIRHWLLLGMAGPNQPTIILIIFKSHPPDALKQRTNIQTDALSALRQWNWRT